MKVNILLFLGLITCLLFFPAYKIFAGNRAVPSSTVIKSEKSHGVDIVGVRTIFDKGSNLGGISWLNIVDNNLIHTDNSSESIYIHSLDDLDGSPIKLKGSYGNIYIATNESGYVAICSQAGEKIFFFNVENPKKSYLEINIPKTLLITCFGLDLEMIEGKSLPDIWIGSPTQEEILKLRIDESNKPNWKILKRYQPITGAFNLKVSKNIVFTLNALIFPAAAVPYIFNRHTGDTLLGNPRGEGVGTSLTRRYLLDISVDKYSDSVFYIKPRERLINAFSYSKPREDTLKEIRVSVNWPNQISRFKNCLVVLGDNNSNPKLPIFSILKNNSQGNLEEIAVTGTISVRRLKNSVFMAIDSSGNIYLSHQYGISSISGLLDQYSCEI